MCPSFDGGFRNPGPALYIVATPIGNLEDITLRALRILGEVDFILCEDSRRTIKLLERSGIKKELVSAHKFNEEKSAGRIIERLRGGESAAYVTDGGTPAVSDPGARLVERVRSAGFPVIAVPGASVVTAAMSVAGWEGGFAFGGFVERKKAARLSQIETVSRLPWACVLFESPLRIRGTLADIAEILGKREILLAREMTKLYEEVIKAPAETILEKLDEKVRGEITLVVFPPPKGKRESLPPGVDLKNVMKACREMIAAGVKRTKAAAIIASLTGIPKQTLLDILTRET